MTSRKHKRAFSLEWRRKLSKAHKGKIPANKGIPWSKELRKKHLKIRGSAVYRNKLKVAKLGSKNPMFGRRDEKSPFWKGKSVSYSGLHKWVAIKLGKPRICLICRKRKSYIDWANKNGKYLRNLSDWVAVCRSCHRTLDGMVFNKFVRNKKVDVIDWLKRQ